MRTIMKNPRTSLSTVALRLLIALAIVLALSAQAVAQTPGGTTISNQASATYSDGTNSYSTVSNTVTVTVSNVSRSEEHTSELQSQSNLVCRLLLEKKKKIQQTHSPTKVNRQLKS